MALKAIDEVIMLCAKMDQKAAEKQNAAEKTAVREQKAAEKATERVLQLEELLRESEKVREIERQLQASLFDAVSLGFKKRANLEDVKDAEAAAVLRKTVAELEQKLRQTQQSGRGTVHFGDDEKEQKAEETDRESIEWKSRRQLVINSKRQA